MKIVKSATLAALLMSASMSHAQAQVVVVGVNLSAVVAQCSVQPAVCPSLVNVALTEVKAHGDKAELMRAIQFLFASAIAIAQRDISSKDAMAETIRVIARFIPDERERDLMLQAERQVSQGRVPSLPPSVVASFN